MDLEVAAARADGRRGPPCVENHMRRGTGLARVSGLCCAALLVLFQPFAFVATRAHAQGQVAQLSEELKRQESIYHGRGDELRSGYTIDRSLFDYTRALPPGFERALSSLSAADRWLDIGAGRGQAVVDYFSLDLDEDTLAVLRAARRNGGASAQVVAMSIEDRRTPVWQKKAESVGAHQMKYMFGKYLREYSAEELGQFQIITDVIGGFSYTENLTLFMEKVLAFLKVDGSFYTVLQDVEHAQGENQPFYPNATFLTEIVRANGSKMKMCEWLKSISCVQVTCESRMGWRPPLEAYHVRKTCADIHVPTLAAERYEAGTPPERRFRLK